MGFNLKLQTTAGGVLTLIGLVGILVSFSIQKSDVDPTALTVAFASISTSIVGISLMIGDPTPKSADKQSP
jgi:xanthosine utilization system XapX-like protein